MRADSKFSPMGEGFGQGVLRGSKGDSHAEFVKRSQSTGIMLAVWIIILV